MKIISTFTRRWMLGSAIVLALFAGCGHQSERPPTARKPVIVATVYPIANLVDQLVGDWVQVRTLPAGDELDRAVLGGADVLIVSGTPKDAKIESEARGLGRRELQILRFTDLTNNHENDSAATCPWLDPLLASQFVTALAPHLQHLVPDRAEPLRNRVMLLRTDLLLLHQEFAARFGDGHHRKLAAWDMTFDSMTTRFGMDTAVHVANVLVKSNPDDTDRLTAAARGVSATGAANIIAPVGNTDPMIQEVAQRAGVTVLWLDPLGSPARPERSTYEKLVRWNLEAILAAQWKK